MNGYEQFTLLPYLDWPVETYLNEDEVDRLYCARQVPGLYGGSHQCDHELPGLPAGIGQASSPRVLLESIRRHAAGVQHVGVIWHLQTWADPHGERHWVDDVREPGPEEIAIAATTPDGSFWRLASGAVVAETTRETAQRYRIVAEVKP